MLLESRIILIISMFTFVFACLPSKGKHAKTKVNIWGIQRYMLSLHQKYTNMRNTDEIGRFLQDTLGINFKDKGVRRDAAGLLPLYLKGIVSIHEGTLNERPHLLCFYSSEVTLSSFSPVKVAKEIKSHYSIPVISILPNIDALWRRNMISARQSFIVPGKQIYLPCMLTYLTINDNKKVHAEKEMLSPLSQLILFYHLLHSNIEDKSASGIAKQLGYSIKSITYALREMRNFELLSMSKLSRSIFIHFEKDNVTLWNESKQYLSTPISRIMYFPDVNTFSVSSEFSSESALIHYVPIISPQQENLEILAVWRAEELIRKLKAQKILKDYGVRKVELWKYNPSLLADEGYVDPLSLYACYKDGKDERVLGELNQVIQQKLK
jgi:hypothetical protein